MFWQVNCHPTDYTRTKKKVHHKMIMANFLVDLGMLLTVSLLTFDGNNCALKQFNWCQKNINLFETNLENSLAEIRGNCDYSSKGMSRSPVFRMWHWLNMEVLVHLCSSLSTSHVHTCSYKHSLIIGNMFFFLFLYFNEEQNSEYVNCNISEL